MSDYSLIQELKRDGTLKLCHDYRSGTARDFSGGGRHGTPSNCEFAGNGLLNVGAGEVTVANDATLQALTSGTLVLFGEFNEQIANERFMSKRGGGVHFDWYINTPTRLIFFDGASSRTINVSIIGSRYIAVNFSSGAIPTMHMDGIYVGPYNAAVTVTGSADILRIGNVVGGGVVGALSSNYGGVVITNSVLTDTQHAQLYGELMS